MSILFEVLIVAVLKSFWINFRDSQYFSCCLAFYVKVFLISVMFFVVIVMMRN